LVKLIQTRNLGQRPRGAVSPTGRQFRGLKFCSYERHLANAIALAYTARAVFILGGWTLTA